jgi:hypothetical protein
MSLSQTFNQDVQGDIGTAGLATTTAPTYSNNVESPLSLNLAGGLRVDGSGVTQPISASTLPLPTGASTSALQITGNTTLATISGQLPTTLGQKTSANSFAVVLASDETVPVTITGSVSSATATQTSVAGSATSVVLLASNTARKGYTIFNDSTSVLFVSYAATATTSAYGVKLFPNGCVENNVNYTGVISGIWLVATGAAKMVEYT